LPARRPSTRSVADALTHVSPKVRKDLLCDTLCHLAYLFRTIDTPRGSWQSPSVARLTSVRGSCLSRVFPHGWLLALKRPNNESNQLRSYSAGGNPETGSHPES